MPQYLVLPLETKGTFAKFGRAEMGAIVKRYGAWTRNLAQKKRLLAGDRIVGCQFVQMNGGKLGAREAGAKEETPGGFWIIRAKNAREALELCADCPHFEFGALQVLQIEGNRRA